MKLTRQDIELIQYLIEREIKYLKTNPFIKDGIYKKYRNHLDAVQSKLDRRKK